MTMVERYLRAVRDFLPRGQQDDIINELSDSIESRFDDEVATKGRPLTEDEQVAILRAYGHPMAVAARYRGDERSVSFGRRLIGPELFPVYLKVLWVNLAITLVFGAIALVAGGSIWSAIAGVIVPFVLQFAIVTAIFVFIDSRRRNHPDAWDPRTVNSMGGDVDVSSLDGISTQLIGREHRDEVPLTTSLLEVGLLGVALTAWLAIGVPEQIAFLKPGPGWIDVWPAATVVLVLALLIPIVTLLRPAWTRFRVAGHVLTNIASIAVLGVSLGLGSWVVLADPAAATQDQVDIAQMIDLIVRISVAATLVLTVVNAALEIRRLVRMNRPHTGSAAAVSNVQRG
jgi:hypothetical protein